MSRGYRCVVPGCMRRVDYGLIPRLFCDQCWGVIDAEIKAELAAAFQDIRRKRLGSVSRWTDAKRACHDAAAAAGVIATLKHPLTSQTGDGAAVTSGSPSPGEPPAAASSPPTVPVAIEDGRRVGADGEALDGPGESTGASTHGEPAHSTAGPSAPTTPETPASAETARGGGLPRAGEQEGEGGCGHRPGGGAAPPNPTETPLPRGRGLT